MLLNKQKKNKKNQNEFALSIRMTPNLLVLGGI